MNSEESSFHVAFCCDPLDVDSVRDFAEQVHAQGMSAALITDDMPGGAEREFALERGLRRAQLAVVFLSKRSVTRAGCLQRAIVAAVEISKEKSPGQAYVVPVRLDACDTHIRLAKLQHIDVFETQGWDRLLKQIRLLHDEHQQNASTNARTRRAADTRRVRMTTRRAPGVPTHTGLPLVTFREPIREFIGRCVSRNEWRQLDPNTRGFLLSLGCKLEPIVQISPATSSHLVLGFECLALGPMGENFPAICARCNSWIPACCDSAWPLRRSSPSRT